MIAALIRALRPSAQEIRDLALRETDPALAGRFEPIALGPLGNAVLLAGIALAAVIITPFRLAIRMLGRR